MPTDDKNQSKFFSLRRTSLFAVLAILALVAVFAFLKSDDNLTDGRAASVVMGEEIDGSHAIYFSPLKESTEGNLEKIKIGRQLFQDTRLSKNNTISCNSCHNLEKGGVDGRQFAVEIDGVVDDINTPTVFNSSLNFRQFWDGRSENLAEALLDSEGQMMAHPKQMGRRWSEIVEQLKEDAEYKRQFSLVYKDGVQARNIVDALVAFESSLLTLDSAFDRYLKGDEKALSEIQLDGYKKFVSYGCVSCHQGQNIGGNMFQTLSVAANYFDDRGGFFASDFGRYNVTKNEEDKHVFRVPGLRNVELTAPYFHDGAVKTLHEAVKKMAHYQLGRPIVDADVEAIVAFMKSLTGKTPASLKNLREVAHE